MANNQKHNPFLGDSNSSRSITLNAVHRPKSTGLQTQHPPVGHAIHTRLFSGLISNNGSDQNALSLSSTFAPEFIKSEDIRSSINQMDGIEGENDFSGKRYVWIRDPLKAFVKGWIIDDLEGNFHLVKCDDGSQRKVSAEGIDKVNPAKFDKADDMAELTHLNEASVVHNLQQRYMEDLIYTYSGLFLVTVNPYCSLPIYNDDYIRMYKGRNKEDTKPHIFAMADAAFRRLIEEGKNQSILVTGESGAGKTENTKKVIQYLAAVATSNASTNKPGAGQLSNLSQQILRANPILESFGNAQTVRNNNSSRFGKFIRIEFSRSGQITGAYIDWYLLEKSRVVRLNSSERNYHVFYQLLRGADQHVKHDLLLSNMGVADFDYLKGGNDQISGISDSGEWESLVEAFRVMGINDADQSSILRTIAAILHLGNLSVTKESIRGDQAILTKGSYEHAKKVCHLLGVPVDAFIEALLHPIVKAGREYVKKTQTPEQVKSAIDAISKGIFERTFADLVARLNRQLDRNGIGSDDSHFIGVLDIAGFEIFENNSFEQLCINYTNEKLQQFFNHHMFVLEQEEYAREQIEWRFIDFGKDLQPTIDLIELPNPIGIFSCLDEDAVMPKATDKTFTEKMHSLWERKTSKYRPSRLNQGFVLTHYAAEVEYLTEGWLEKNRDPLNDNITMLLAQSTDNHVVELFADCGDPDGEPPNSRNRVKKGLFRTVAQRHKEQLSSLMSQLDSTNPHFVRCILPNHKKKSKQFDSLLVLDQLRCNGVLEGIRIARTGFPNRLPFAEFRSRYEVLSKDIHKGHLEGQAACKAILERLKLDRSFYRIGLTKVFFRAGVLAELEDQRDTLIRNIMLRFQSVARGFIQRRIANKRLYRAEATRVIQDNFNIYLGLSRNPWWKLFVRMKPLLGATRVANEVKKRDELIQKLRIKIQEGQDDKQKLEDERRRTESEISKVKHTLESERALALDKEEIFKRLQLREAELNEKLAGAIEDQEHLEDQLDSLIQAKKKSEEQIDGYRSQLEQAGTLVTRLESEKKFLADQIVSLEKRLKEIEQKSSEKNEKEQSLTHDKKMLQSQLQIQQRKVSELETKLLKTDQDLDVKLATTTKELGASRKETKHLLEQNRQIREELSNLSTTSTAYEDIVRRKESEISVLKSDQHRNENERRLLETERNKFFTDHENLQTRLRHVQAELEATKSQKSQLEREARDAKQLLKEKLSEDIEAVKNREVLEGQIKDLKEKLFNAQTDLSKERQSRDDVLMLGKHKVDTLQEEYERLNEAKITIEKEMYVQEDKLRRAIEARTSAESDRKNLQSELKKLRERFTKAEELRMEAEAGIERSITRQANERTSALQEDLEHANTQLKQVSLERTQLSQEVQELNHHIADSESFRTLNDQHKERLERELVTIKGRLTASENDNRALLNKIQQKNLDIARSNSRASESHRSRLTQIQFEKSKLEENNRKISKQLEEAHLSMASLEKQKEKLSLTVEDLTHEAEREHKSCRNAEKASSAASIQLVELNQQLESQKQLKTQAQSNTKIVQSSLDEKHKELEELRRQVLLMHAVFTPDYHESTPTWEEIQPRLSESLDLAQKLEVAQKALSVAQERCTRAEAHTSELRKRFEEELMEMDTRLHNSKRNLLEELNSSGQNALPARRSPTHLRKHSDTKQRSNISTPERQRSSGYLEESPRADKTIDSLGYHKRMDLAAELESTQDKLRTAEMRNRHLQAQLDRKPPSDNPENESPSMRRVAKLERANGRLHEQLDDSARKVSALERNIRAGELSLRDIQAKSHGELFDLINSQEDSRRCLLTAHNSALAEITEIKAQFDNLKQAKSKLDVDYRDAKSELQELLITHEHEKSNRSQLMQDVANVQIRLDTNSSKLEDATSSMNLYKSRADEYFNKLEHAELAIVKANRSESFAKQQAREAEELCATVMADRKDLDAKIEDLRHENQRYEEKLEDMSADIQVALQAKKRLQHELEDYRSQRAIDVEDRETSLEQMRKKYQNEFSSLTNELEIERDNLNHVRAENTRLRDESEELRAKWDDEVLNSSTWAKEKARLEMTKEDLSKSREEALSALNESQSKVVSLLSQVRELRNNMDDISAQRDLLSKEKRGLENRLNESNERFEELARGESPSMKNAVGMDRELLELKTQLAQREDVTDAAVGKMRRAEALATEMQKDVTAERETNIVLHREKAALEKSLKELHGRVVELESKGYSSASHDVRFLNGRVKELEQQLEDQESAKAKDARSVRNSDRNVRDLQGQIERREKQNVQLSEEIGQKCDKIDRLIANIDELQAEESKTQLALKRVERDLREEKEERLRLERELEGWKSLRVERSLLGSAAGKDDDRQSSYTGSIRLRKSDTLKRQLSNSKVLL